MSSANLSFKREGPTKIYHLGNVRFEHIFRKLYPMIGMEKHSSLVRANFGGPFVWVPVLTSQKDDDGDSGPTHAAYASSNSQLGRSESES